MHRLAGTQPYEWPSLVPAGWAILGGLGPSVLGVDLSPGWPSISSGHPKTDRTRADK